MTVLHSPLDPATSTTASPPTEATATAQRSTWRARLRARLPWAMVTAVVVGFVAVVVWLIYAPRPEVWTDDAYVHVHYATIAPRVAGQVVSVKVDDNDTVEAGQVLVELDDRDYRVAVATAEATLARDQALVENAAAAIVRQGPLIEQAQTQTTAAAAELSFAQTDVKRFNRLAPMGYAPVRTQQQAQTTSRDRKAALDGAQAALQAARAQMNILKAQQLAAEATVRADEAQLEQARLNLSYTKILAPVDGMIAQRGVQVGNYVDPGAAMMAVVPLSETYIEANYREVQLTHVEPGQRARIHIDAYNIDLEGTVVGVPAATGATFATLQPDDATGNFTKIVQRLPIRIAVAPGQPLARLLRVGLSVETTIDTGLANVVATYRDANREPKS